MDWVSRAVLAWRLSNTLGADFCVEALEEALEEALGRYGRPEIFNTDQSLPQRRLGVANLRRGSGCLTFRVHLKLPGLNTETSWMLPMQARYVIGQDGMIAYADINPDYRHQPEPAEILPVLRRLQSGTSAGSRP